MSLVTQEDRASVEGSRRARAAGRTRRRARGAATGLRAYGEPLLWLTSGGLAFSIMMILGLLTLVVAEGIDTFWPLPVVRIESAGAPAAVGEVTRIETFEPTAEVVNTLPENARAAAHAALGRAGGLAERQLVRTGNFEITGEHFRWVSDYAVTAQSLPAWALTVERRTWGRFYGEAVAYLVDGNPVADSPEKVVAELDARLPAIRERWQERRYLEVHEIGRVNREVEEARLAVRGADRRYGRHSQEHDEATAAAGQVEAATAVEFAAIRERIAKLDADNARDEIVLRTADGKDVKLQVSGIVRAYAANQLGITDKLGIYLSRWWEFLSDDPREANSEGGVFPAIFGTVAMTLLMSLMVTPFGVLAALYLREYARGGLVISAVRIAINNLAGVPSIVFGVFGLGFFCYIVGASLDELLFADKLPTPTFGTGGILWASLTLALLTLPVVIVATEEALAAVPNSMREGSYACGASKWQTIQRIVLPRAMPGILTGMILAIARGAGEVAPLMLVGAVKLAPELPIDGIAPFVHLQRSFMHLGFHIYDVGFQSQNSEAAKPMVYTTTLLLIMIIASLNLAAIWLRARLRRRFVTSQF